MIECDTTKDGFRKMAIGDDWPELLTVKEVAKILRVSSLTIKRWGKRGKLPAIRINSRGDRRYKKEAVLWLLGVTPKQISQEPPTQSS
jgi:excisionase family DNA binding protein